MDKNCFQIISYNIYKNNPYSCGLFFDELFFVQTVFIIKYLPRKRKKRMTFLRNRDKMDIGYKGYGGSADEKQI